MSKHEKLEQNLKNIDAYFEKDYNSKDGIICRYAAISSQLF